MKRSYIGRCRPVATVSQRAACLQMPGELFIAISTHMTVPKKRGVRSRVQALSAGEIFMRNRKVPIDRIERRLVIGSVPTGNLPSLILNAVQKP